MFVAVWVH